MINEKIQYVLNCTKGLYIALLEDDTGAKTHTVGINVYRKEIYDCMESSVIKLSRDNLSHCCGPDRTIVDINVLAEIAQI